MTTTQQHSHQENLVALSADFHTHWRYQKFYEKRCDALSGFIGLYDLIIRMAQRMTDWEAANPKAYDEGVDWIELCEGYCDEIIAQSLAEGGSSFVTTPYTALKAALKRQENRRADEEGIAKAKGGAA